MEITNELFEIKDGFGYKILQDGVPFIIQDCMPNVEGFQTMTKEEAESFTEELVTKFRGTSYGDYQ